MPLPRAAFFDPWRDEASPLMQRFSGVEIMDRTFIARCSGVDVQSVLEYRQVDRAHILRIDPNKEPALRNRILAGAAGKAGLAEDDIFQASMIADGAAREFPTRFIDAQLTDKFEDEVGDELVWKLGGETYPPDSLFQVPAERIDFNVFERHNGKQFDLSLPNDGWSRPWVAYGMVQILPGGDYFWVWIQPTSGHLEVHIDDNGDGRTRLSGVFANVHFDVPNLQFIIPQLPDRPFEVDVGNGHYEIFWRE